MDVVFTLLWMFAFVMTGKWILGSIAENIGRRVHNHEMDKEDAIREAQYKESFNSYIRSINDHISAQSNPATTWVPTDVYKDYLKSPEWREKARLRVHLDRYECKYCGSEVKSRIDDSHSPNVHHFHYRNIMNENVYEDLVTLCKTCHNNLHKNYSIEEMEVEIKTHGVAYK